MSSPGSLFDIMGPVMVGPSSSHTAGAVRLALLARNVAQIDIQKITFVLYNSFAKTYQGHGTDKGLLAGILGFAVNDSTIRDIFSHPDALALGYTFVINDEANHYPPNTVIFKMTLVNGETLDITGHSLGGGKIYISKINEFAVSLRGDYPTVMMIYRDQPGMIWQVTKIIAEEHINIASLNCTRQVKGQQAFMTICLDALLPQAQVNAVRAIEGVDTVRNVDKIPS